MTALRRLMVLVLLLLGPLPCAAAERPVTVLVSIDGFRADYLDRGVTPNLSTLAAQGARAAMRPSFPSKTFPNHYTLVTGLRPDRNGIVENNMEDARIPGVTFKMSDRAAVVDRRWWDEAEPIWVTAEKAGVRTAPIFWPGSEAPIHGVRPSRYEPFDQKVPSETRVDHLLAAVDAGVGFATLYLDIVDTAGHDFGPDSAETNAAVAHADQVIGRLVAGLKARGLAANLVIVADHGMAALSDDRVSYLDDLTPRASFRSLAGGAFITVYPQPGRKAELERNVLGAHPHFTCWRKGEIPKRYQYGKNPRVAPIFCQAETGWRITTRDYRPSKPERGNHGFDPAAPEMAAIFIANGPTFRPGVRLATFDNVDVYPLLARLVGVKAKPGDGSLKPIRPALVDR